MFFARLSRASRRHPAGASSSERKRGTKVNYGYKGTLGEFKGNTAAAIKSLVEKCRNYCVLRTQNDAWIKECEILQQALNGFDEGGVLYLEYTLPGLPRRPDALLLLNGILFVFEFKIHERRYGKNPSQEDIFQVEAYAGALADYHSASHECPIVPVLIDTGIESIKGELRRARNNIYRATYCHDARGLKAIVEDAIKNCFNEYRIADYNSWDKGGYAPAPTVLDVMDVMCSDNADEDILRTGVGQDGVKNAVQYINGTVVRNAQRNREKVICFVTGVPGAGKTLVGLKVAGERNGVECGRTFVSGNLPLMNVLRAKYACDTKKRIMKHKEQAEKDGTWDEKWRAEFESYGYTVTCVGGGRRIVGRFNENSLQIKTEAMLKLVKAFREECGNAETPPQSRIVVFDEAQRVWTEDDEDTQEGVQSEQESEACEILNYMSRVDALTDKGEDWCVLIALVGTGQDIGKDEKGIDTWYKALADGYDDWRICVPVQDNTDAYHKMAARHGEKLEIHSELFLNNPMREFRGKDVRGVFGELVVGD